MTHDNSYKKLPGRQRTSVGLRSLWLGADHLLAVDRGYFEERYRRFYFSDIQALVVKTTVRWHVATVILTVLTLVLLAPGWMLWQNDEYGFFFLSLLPSTLCLIGLIVNLAKGRSCRCFLQMKVGVHDLPSIRRRRQAEKVLARIRPLIEAVQKGLPVSTLNSSVPIKNENLKATALIRPCSGRWHLALFLFLIVDMAAGLWHLFDPGMGIYLVNVLFGLTVLLLAIAGLVTQRNTRLPGRARVATWTVLGTYLTVNIAASFYTVFYFLLKDPTTLSDQSRQINALANLQTMDHPFLIVLAIAYVVVGSACVVFGLLGIFQHRRESTPEATI